MKADTVLTAIIAVCCVFAIGATSTTLDSTVSTDPEDVTKVEYEKIPLGEGDAKKLDEAIDGGQTGSDSGDGEPQQQQSSGSGENTQQAESSGSDGESQQQQNSESNGESQQQQSSESGQETEQSGGSTGDSGNGLAVTEPTLLERLLSLLRDLLDALLTALPYAVLLAILGTVVRYRDRLLSPVASRAADATGASGFEPNPDNEVASAWFEMVERLDLADRRHLTPRECAAAARRQGVDTDAVRRLTTLFEEVRYGGARVTDERCRLAEVSIRRVRTQLEGQ